MCTKIGDMEGNKFEVKKVTWINYRYGEEADEKDNLEFVRLDDAFVRFKVDAMEQLTSVSFCKKTQGVQLTLDMLLPVTLDKRLLLLKVKQDYKKLPQKKLSEAPKGFIMLQCHAVTRTQLRIHLVFRYECQHVLIFPFLKKLLYDFLQDIYASFYSSRLQIQLNFSDNY